MTHIDPKTVDLNETWPAPIQALWWLKKGDLRVGTEWEKAHEIVQQNEGDALHDWVHALVHWIEGDDWNAGYWYKSSGHDRLGDDIGAEWTAISRKMCAELGL